MFYTEIWGFSAFWFFVFYSHGYIISGVGSLVCNCFLLFVKTVSTQYRFSSSGVSHSPHGSCPHSSLGCVPIGVLYVGM